MRQEPRRRDIGVGRAGGRGAGGDQSCSRSAAIASLETSRPNNCESSPRVIGWKYAIPSGRRRSPSTVPILSARRARLGWLRRTRAWCESSNRPRPRRSHKGPRAIPCEYRRGSAQCCSSRRPPVPDLRATPAARMRTRPPRPAPSIRASAEVAAGPRVHGRVRRNSSRFAPKLRARRAGMSRVRSVRGSRRARPAVRTAGALRARRGRRSGRGGERILVEQRATRPSLLSRAVSAPPQLASPPVVRGRRRDRRHARPRIALAALPRIATTAADRRLGAATCKQGRSPRSVVETQTVRIAMHRLRRTEQFQAQPVRQLARDLPA